LSRALFVLLVTITATSSVACDDASDGDDGGGGGGGAPAGQACEVADDGPLLVCRCVDNTIPSRGCAGRTGAMTCETTCEGTCAGSGGVDPAHPETCLDPAAAGTGTPGTTAIGERCVVSGFDESDCASGVCLPEGDTFGYCSAACTTDADCGPLSCRTFTLGGEPKGLCAAPTVVMCSD